MADVKGSEHGDEDVEEVTPGYKPPAEKTLQELAQLDADDEAMQKYKDSLGVSGAQCEPVCKCYVFLSCCHLQRLYYMICFSSGRPKACYSYKAVLLSRRSRANGIGFNRFYSYLISSICTRKFCRPS